MKNYFLILAALCFVLFTGCKKDEGFGSSGNEDKTEQKPGNNGDDSDDQNGEEDGEDQEPEPEPVDPMVSMFPDPLFRAYVLEHFDTDGDGIISEEEALAVTEINVKNRDNYYNDESKCIKSLEGVQYFTNLASLSCEYNQLTTLDVSNNTKLKDLTCYSNQLTSLDVSKNTALYYLYCSSNQLTSLDISKNTVLTYLYCYSNQIEELDLSKTNLMNSEYNKNSNSYYPLDCAPMETLKKVYLKKGWSIKWITDDWNRSSNYIPAHTEIIFVD